MSEPPANVATSWGSISHWGATVKYKQYFLGLSPKHWSKEYTGISITNTPLSNGILHHSMRSRTYIFRKTAMVTDVSIKVLKEFTLYSSDWETVCTCDFLYNYFIEVVQQEENILTDNNS